MYAFAHETLSVTNGAAVSLTNATYNPTTGAAGQASVDVEGGSVRYWLDGGDPTPTSGKELNDGDVLVLDGAKEISNVRFIAESATVKLNVQYYR